MSHPNDSRGSGAVPASEPSFEVLEADVFQDLLGSLSDPVTVAALYRKFVVNAAQFIGELAHQEGPARIETLHTLKGSAAMLGARRLTALAASLQAQAQASSVQVAQAMEELNRELAQFRAAADARLSALGAPL